MRFTARSFIGLSVMLLFIIISQAPSAEAEDGEVYQVGTSNLNVRTAPTKEAAIVGKLNKGDKVVVFTKKHGWAQTYYNGEEVWVASQFLYNDDHQSSEVNNTSNTVTITATDVQVRTGPGTAFNVTRSVENNKTYNVLDSRDDWVKIDLGSGHSGWVAVHLTNQDPSSSQNKTVEKANAINQTSDQQTKGNKQGNLSGYTIVIDPGHGGEDPGTIGLHSEYEKDLTLSTANRVVNRLEEAGATVRLTRSNDRYVSLESRVAFSNAQHTDAFISLHYDGYESQHINGFSTHYYSPSGQDQTLAYSIQNGLRNHLKMNSRGIMKSDYFVLRENSDLAVLVELGFLSNLEDLSTIQTKDHQQQVSEGITSGLINFFN